MPVILMTSEATPWRGEHLHHWLRECLMPFFAQQTYLLLHPLAMAAPSSATWSTWAGHRTSVNALLYRCCCCCSLPAQQKSSSALCDYSCADVCSPPCHHWVSQKQMGKKSPEGGNQRKRVVKSRNKKKKKKKLKEKIAKAKLNPKGQEVH